MQAALPLTGDGYARRVDVSKRIRWDIERDVIRNRNFDFGRKFLPDRLSLVDCLGFLTPADKIFMSQVQGRTYANLFGLLERFIAVKMLDVSREHWLGNQLALEALVRFTDQELKHQEMFRRLEDLAADGMPAGYRFRTEPNAVASVVSGKRTWAVLGLACDIELLTHQHYRSSLEPEDQLSDLWRDVFLYHWKEESQHAVLDELEWMLENEKLSNAERDAAVDDLMALIGALDAILQVQADADADYFMMHCSPVRNSDQARAIRAHLLRAYRWQYITVGVQDPRFASILGTMITDDQAARIGAALAPIVQ